jgi:uncharacterized membrane protein
MKNLLAFLAAAVLVFVGVGWYLNWFHINDAPAAPGHHAYSIDLNGEKIGSDVKAGGEKVVDAIEKARLEAEARKAEADKKAAAAVKSASTDTKTLDWSKSEK